MSDLINKQAIEITAKLIAQEALKTGEAAGYILGNTTAIADKANKGLVWVARTFISGYSGLKASEDIAGIAEDIICRDKVCTALGCIALCCDFCTATCAYVSYPLAGKVQSGSIGVGMGCRNLRKICKNHPLGLFGGCK